MPDSSDEALVERARERDFAAFEELMGRYDDKVYRLAMRFMRNEADAEEVLQETFLSVWRKLDSFKGESRFGSWLYRIAANTALMRLRSQRRHPEVSSGDFAPDVLDALAGDHHGGDDWSKRPDDQLQSEELRRRIQTAVDALPEIYRTVFLVRDVEGLSTEETAEILDITVPTVKTRLHRARLVLRGAITDYFQRT